MEKGLRPPSRKLTSRVPASQWIFSVRHRLAAAVGAEGEFEDPGVFLLVANLPRNPVLILRLQNQIGRERIDSFVSAFVRKRNRKIEGVMPFGCINCWLGISLRDLRTEEMPDFLDRQLDGDFDAKVSKARRPNPQENLIIRKHLAVPIERHSRDPRQGLFFSGDPFGAISLRTIISHSRKTIKQLGHPIGRGVPGGCKTAQQNSVRVEVIERSMSAPEGHTLAAFFDQPSGVNIMVV